MKMTRESPIISVRVTHEELEMLEALIAQTRTRMEAQGFPPTVTASGLFRTWLREKAKDAGIKTGPVRPPEPGNQLLFPEILPAPKIETPAPVVEIPVPVEKPVVIVTPPPAPAPIVEVLVPVSAAPVVEKVPAPQLVDEPPTPTEGLSYDVRNRVALALSQGVFKQNELARLAGVDTGGMSKFVKGAKSLGRPKLEALDLVLKRFDV